MIRFACPGCSTAFTVPVDKAGKVSKCPKCNASFTIPEPYSPPVESGGHRLPHTLPPPVVVPPPPPPAAANDPIEIQPCPKCQSRLSVLAADLGSEIECPSCRTTYKAARADAPLPPGGTFSTPAGSKLVQLGSGRGSQNDDEDDDKPRRKKRRRYDDDEDDDDYEPAPKKKRIKRSGGGRAPGTVSLTRLGPLSVGLNMAIISAVMTLIYGFFWLLVGGCLGAVFGSQIGDSRFVGLLGAGILMGIVYTLVGAVFSLIFGFIGGVLFALIYNTVARMTGGVEMDLE
jgi:DNA-directed RNA polymerase subunit M/transcription elongation factor TFIIS